ncbi:hypothetical protein FXO37_26639 [Capsicum annuum]|nr:hypothetical protein FXO37_26639 [Capsicum annuum]
METQVFFRHSLGQGNRKKKPGPDSANVIFNDLSGRREEVFFNPICSKTNEQVQTLIRGFLELELETVTNEVYAGQGTPIADPRNNAMCIIEAEVMEESSVKTDLSLEIQEEQHFILDMQSDKQIEEWLVEDVEPIQNEMTLTIQKEKETSM